jgi:hypothetical protein
MQSKSGFTPLNPGRGPDVILQPSVKRRKTPFTVRYDLHSKIYESHLQATFRD